MQLPIFLVKRQRVPDDSLRFTTPNKPGTSLQRELSVAPGSCFHGARQEAVIGSLSSTTASMTGIERAAVIQRGRPPVRPPTRGRMSAARRVELTLSTRCGQSGRRFARSEPASQTGMGFIRRPAFNGRKFMDVWRCLPVVSNNDCVRCRSSPQSRHRTGREGGNHGNLKKIT